MRLDDRELEFIYKRQRLVRYWPLTLLSMVVMLVGGYAWLFIYHPGLADPFFAVNAMKSGTLPADTMQLSSVILPVVVSFLFFVVVIMLFYLHAAISNEKKYQAIIDKLR